MVIDFQTTNFKSDVKLRDFIREKLQKFDKYYSKIINATVYLKVNKSSDKQNKTVEIKINLPESQLFVEENDRTFEAATDRALESLKNQIAKLKSRSQTA
jgi:putative sigma-54 modulation protein